MEEGLTTYNGIWPGPLTAELREIGRTTKLVSDDPRLQDLADGVLARYADVIREAELMMLTHGGYRLVWDEETERPVVLPPPDMGGVFVP
jgi:hypothetical protein